MTDFPATVLMRDATPEAPHSLASKARQATYDDRWQEHYDGFLDDLDGRGGVCAHAAAEQYADDMMAEETELRAGDLGLTEPPMSDPFPKDALIAGGMPAELLRPRAVAFDPNARAYEAFSFGGAGTGLLDPLKATTLDHALAEMTERHRMDRGDRVGVREIGPEVDRLHVYACRRTDQIESTRPCYDNPYGRTALSYKRRLEHICTIDLRVISGEHIELIGNPSLDERRRRAHAERQAQRPEDARR